MSLNIHRVQVWTGEIPDRPGAAAAQLEVLAHAGVNLEYVFTRPHPHKADMGVIFLAPISGADQTKAARAAGLAPALDVAMLCVMGPQRPGIGFELMSRLAIAGLNLRGLSVSTAGDCFTAYLAFDNVDTATQAVQILAAG